MTRSGCDEFLRVSRGYEKRGPPGRVCAVLCCAVLGFEKAPARHLRSKTQHHIAQSIAACIRHMYPQGKRLRKLQIQVKVSLPSSHDHALAQNPLPGVVDLHPLIARDEDRGFVGPIRFGRYDRAHPRILARSQRNSSGVSRRTVLGQHLPTQIPRTLQANHPDGVFAGLNRSQMVLGAGKPVARPRVTGSSFNAQSGSKMIRHRNLKRKGPFLPHHAILRMIASNGPRLNRLRQK